MRGLEVVVDEADMTQALREQPVADRADIGGEHVGRDRDRAGETGRALGHAVADRRRDHRGERALLVQELAGAYARGREMITSAPSPRCGP